MIHNIIKDKPTRLFIFLGGFFIANAIIAEIIGVKIFSLEETFGFTKASFTLLGESGLSYDLTVGVLPWPIVFIMTDIINEYYGVRGVRFLSVLTAVLIAFAFVVFYFSIHTSATGWWRESQTAKGVPDMQAAYTQILGQGMNIIFASLTAFLVGQLTDAIIFKKIKQITGEKNIWMRATISTLFSQLVDTVVVSYIYLYFSLGFSFPKVTAIALVGYTYKFTVAILCTPIIYLIHGFIERYLGHKQAAEMKNAAMKMQITS
ncbi:queuosine precursor transporter [Flavihumibacter profundi]|uniref:queuosine precursor transporter n=1 Tax=Flavihumibacter profundi TaxID=2716883 RepID=UPI001CC7003C|nr:queuosine precursor transporter [Flavihumibacter profundi]MBZ5856362.1 queuosine precursor transporter [Flavihumibacter profundi]